MNGISKQATQHTTHTDHAPASGTVETSRFTSWRAAQLAGLALLLGIVALAVPARLAYGAPDPEHRLRIGSIVPEGTPWADQLIDVKNGIEKRSGGRIKVTLYLSGRKGSEEEIMKKLRRGTLQGAGVSNGALASLVQAFLVLELPYLFENTAECDYIIDEVIGEDLAAKALEHGIQIGAWAENGWRSMASKKIAIRRLEDLQHLKVRAQETPTNLELWRVLNVTNVPIPLDEVLTALEAGIINGFDQTPIYTAAAGWHTQIKSFTLTRHVYQPGAVIYDKRFLDKLPEDLRAVVLEETAAEGLKNREWVRKVNAQVLEEFGHNQIEVVELSPEELARFRAAVQPVYTRLRDKIGADLVDKVRAALTEYRAKAKAKAGEE